MGRIRNRKKVLTLTAMKLKSLGYKSLLIFTDFDGKAEDRGDHWAIHTLSDPNFFWGNLLIFDRPPQAGDFASWTTQFKNEFLNPAIYHITLAWDSSTGEVGNVSEFLKNGFRLESTCVLSASRIVRPPKFNDGVKVRKLKTENDWQRVIEIQIASAHEHLSRAEWESFYRRQAERYRRMEAAGLGNWYGAFIEEKLVGSLGIFYRNRLGRFQTVSTDPNYQRQGVCQTLVYQASEEILNSGQVDELVMCADPDYHAIKIYEMVGFKRQITEHGVYWWDKDRSP